MEALKEPRIAVDTYNKSTNSQDSQQLSEKDLDFWVMQNMQVMNMLSIYEPNCWSEVDVTD